MPVPSHMGQDGSAGPAGLCTPFIDLGQGHLMSPVEENTSTQPSITVLCEYLTLLFLFLWFPELRLTATAQHHERGCDTGSWPGKGVAPTSLSYIPFQTFLFIYLFFKDWSH